MRAISSMATRHLLTALLDAAHAVGLPKVSVESVGGVDAARRVSAGEDFDLVFLADDAITALADDGRVFASTVRPLVRSDVALMVAEPGSRGATPVWEPAFPDANAVRTGLRSAGRVGYSTGPSGKSLLRLIDDWGLAAEMEGRLIQARPGIPVAAMVSEGTVDLGFQQMSEIVGHRGVRILGVLPEDCAITTVFSGAVVIGSLSTEDATAVLSFLTSAASGPIKIEHNFGLATSRSGPRLE